MLSEQRVDRRSQALVGEVHFPEPRGQFLDTRGWVLSATGVSFKVSVADGGQRAIKDKRGIVTIVYQPDYFAMDIPNYVVPGESTTLQQLNGGNLMVK